MKGNEQDSKINTIAPKVAIHWLQPESNSEMYCLWARPIMPLINILSNRYHSEWRHKDRLWRKLNRSRSGEGFESRRFCCYLCVGSCCFQIWYVLFIDCLQMAVITYRFNCNSHSRCSLQNLLIIHSGKADFPNVISLKVEGATRHLMHTIDMLLDIWIKVNWRISLLLSWVSTVLFYPQKKMTYHGILLIERLKYK